VLCTRSLHRKGPGGLFFMLCALMALVSTLFFPFMNTMNASYTTKPFAEALKPRLSSDSEVFIYDHPGPFYDFAFYLDHPIRLVGMEGEMENFRDDPAASRVSISREDFQARLAGGKPLYALIRRSDYDHLDGKLRQNLKILMEDRRKVLFTSGGAS
jgi:hypothetical protein